MPNVLPDRIVVTERLTLRLPQESDGPALIEAVQDPIIPHWTGVVSPYGQQQFDEWLLRAQTWHAAGDLRKNYILEDEHEALIGMVGAVRVREEDASAEVGYWIGKAHRGKGHTVCALHSLVRELLVAGYERIEAEVIVGNVASQRVLERAGFLYEGLLRSVGNHHSGRRIDVHLYSVIPTDTIAMALNSP